MPTAALQPCAAVVDAPRTIENRLVEEIYAAAAAPALWEKILDELARLSDAEGCALVATGSEGVRWLSSPAIRSMVGAWASSQSVRGRGTGLGLAARNAGRLLADLDGFTWQEADRSPCHTQFLRANGWVRCAGAVVGLPTGDVVVLSIEKARRKGPMAPQAIAMLESLRPHLVRSFSIATRIARARAQTALESLQSAGVAAAIVRRTGALVDSNTLFSRCHPAVLVDANRHVVFGSERAQRAFRQALSAVDDEREGFERNPIVVPGSEGADALIVRLHPLAFFREDIFLVGSAILTVIPLEQRAPDKRLLEMLFDLTPTEARVASLLARGQPVHAIARSQSVAANTVRMHLKSVFVKTGVHRQAELVSLLSTVPADLSQRRQRL